MSDGLQVMLPPELLAAVVDAVAERVLERLDEREPRGNGQQWFSVESAAAYLDCSPERIRKLISRREIPYYSEGVGCRISLKRSDLDEWLDGLRHEVRGGGA